MDKKKLFAKGNFIRKNRSSSFLPKIAPQSNIEQKLLENKYRK
jgi:hypothetical protein